MARGYDWLADFFRRQGTIDGPTTERAGDTNAGPSVETVAPKPSPSTSPAVPTPNPTTEPRPTQAPIQ